MLKFRLGTCAYLTRQVTPTFRPAKRRRTCELPLIWEPVCLAPTACTVPRSCCQIFSGLGQKLSGSFTDNYCSCACSALACFRMGMSGSASFQSVKKSW